MALVTSNSELSQIRRTEELDCRGPENRTNLKYHEDQGLIFSLIGIMRIYTK